MAVKLQRRSGSNDVGSVEESRRLALGNRKSTRSPQSVDASRRLLALALSEAEWQAKVVAIAKSEGWAFYHALPAQWGVPPNLKKELEAALAALYAGRLPVAVRIVAGLLNQLKGKWRTPVTSKGFPDLLLVRKDRMVVAELKSEAGKVRPEQEEWLQRLAAAIGEENVFVWQPSDEVQVRKVLAA